jgi:hypothetical protein
MQAVLAALRGAVATFASLAAPAVARVHVSSQEELALTLQVVV